MTGCYAVVMVNDKNTLHAHPVADLFPMLDDDELADLATDIKANGLQSPIVVDGDTLIDGRNRLAACEMAGVEPRFVELNGADPVAFILSANLARRHMTKGQRAMAAAKVASIQKIPQKDAASEYGVSKGQVSHARQVLDADPGLADAVLAGTIPLNEAYSTIQERRKDTERQTRQREQLREMAPDLDDAVSEEVTRLADALAELQAREQKQKEERRDALDLLERILTLVAPDHADTDFIQGWSNQLGPLTPRMMEKTRKAGEVLLALADRMETE